jgi:hypothetical protein
MKKRIASIVLVICLLFSIGFITPTSVSAGFDDVSLESPSSPNPLDD